MTIRLLPQTLINQIAAGEVIERPASALKELTENALDAGATSIEIQIRNAGKSYLRITDNGSGMTPDELVLAVERHATSKLPTEDLFDIKTLGFRGEALPSIGAISRLTLTSRSINSSEAWRIKVEGGIKSTLEPASHPVGCTVEVADLFFATPARLKFLKADVTEVGHIVEHINRIAMGRPDVAFKLTDERKEILNYPVEAGETPSAQRLARLKRIVGNDFTDNCLEVLTEREGISVTGFVGLPTLNRANANQQFLYVNQRPVKDKVLAASVRAAYQDLLARDRHPVLVLGVEMSRSEVDMNVHPAKTEVRFQNPNMVRGLIISAIKTALGQGGFKTSTTVSQAALGAFRPGQNENQNQVSKSFSQPSNQPSRFSFQTPPMGRPLASMSPPPSLKEPVILVRGMEAVEKNHPLMEEIHRNYPLGIPKAQVHGTYIVAESSKGLVLVDMHAAHERLVYEKMKKQYEETGLQRQMLLIPEMVVLTPSMVADLLSYTEDLKKLGFVFEQIGDKNILIREVPALLGEFDYGKLLRDLAEEIDSFGQPLSLKEKIQEVLSKMACHGSVRSGKRMSYEEMDALLREMEETPYSGQCNHGRPTYVELDKGKLESLFGRS